MEAVTSHCKTAFPLGGYPSVVFRLFGAVFFVDNYLVTRKVTGRPDKSSRCVVPDSTRLGKNKVE